MPHEKPLHQYRKRAPTEDELNLATKMLAEGKSIRAIALALECGTNRAKRICDMIEVQKNAIHLRETEMVPTALKDLFNAVEGIQANMIHVVEVTMAWETQLKKINKAVAMQRLQLRRLREDNSKLKSDNKALREAMRKRGMQTPSK